MLQFQLLRIDAVARERFIDSLDQGPREELRRKQVDPDPQRRPSFALPLGKLAACFIERPPPDRQFEGASLDYGKELDRREQAPDRMVPTDQRLRPNHASVIK